MISTNAVGGLADPCRVIDGVLVTRLDQASFEMCSDDGARQCALGTRSLLAQRAELVSPAHIYHGRDTLVATNRAGSDQIYLDLQLPWLTSDELVDRTPKVRVPQVRGARGSSQQERQRRVWARPLLRARRRAGSVVLCRASYDMSVLHDNSDPDVVPPPPGTTAGLRSPATWLAVGTLVLTLQPGVPGGAWSWPIALLAGLVVAWMTSRHNLPPLAAPLAGVTAWVVALAVPWSLPRLALVAGLVLALLLLGEDRWRQVAAFLAAWLPVLLVAAVLLRDRTPGEATRLLEAAAAVLAGLGAWVAADRLGQPGARLVPRLRAAMKKRWLSAASTTERLLPHEASGMVRLQGVALVLVAATLPLGEGAAFGAAGLLLVVLLVRGRALTWRAVCQPPARTVLLAISAWLVIGLLAAAWSGNGLLQARELGRITPWLLAPVVFLGAINLDACWRSRSAAAFILVLAVSCAVALVQVYLNPEIDAPGLRWLAHLSAIKQAHVPGEANRLVAGGFYLHRLKLAHVLVLGLGILIGRQLLVGLQPRRRVAELAVICLFGLTLLLTYARASVLGVLAGVAAVAALASNRWRLAAAGAMVAAALVALSQPTIRSRILSIAAPRASSTRVAIWRTAVDIIDTEPWGVGLSNYPVLASRHYDRLTASQPFPPNSYAHSLLLSAWAEGGPFGLLAFLWLWVTLGWSSLRAALRARSAEQHSAAAAGLFAAVAFWMVGTTHDVLYHKPVALTFAALVGLVLAVLVGQEQTSGYSRERAETPRRPD